MEKAKDLPVQGGVGGGGDKIAYEMRKAWGLKPLPCLFLLSQHFSRFSKYTSTIGLREPGSSKEYMKSSTCFAKN